ncbi:hypothetical protein B0T22DRAFT_517913 [Podospora appendiculata]|uniref:Uncharacterized protein n=1 Tax=Podospora appendiculata TaxID=314037 RepID=A0AAE0X640_9PEZI|nr:hypothetical protein B0T22DRAFT_517913 [Podospora appendiculata]
MASRDGGDGEDEWDAEAQWLEPRMFPPEFYNDYIPKPAPATMMGADKRDEEALDEEFAAEGEVNPPGRWNEENPWAKPYPWLPVSSGSKNQAGPGHVSKGKERAVDDGENDGRDEPHGSASRLGPANDNEAGDNSLVPDSNSGRPAQTQMGQGQPISGTLTASSSVQSLSSSSSSSSLSSSTGQKRKRGRPKGVKNRPKYDENNNLILSVSKRKKLRREEERARREAGNAAASTGTESQPSESVPAAVVGQAQGQGGLVHPAASTPISRRRTRLAAQNEASAAPSTSTPGVSDSSK